MQRACLVLMGILLVIVGVLPTAAQGGSIASIIDSRSDLSTLKIFLDAADPSVRETLSDSGSFTMFAPNNVAFQNLSSLLEIPLQDLLQSPEIVTQLLQYHIIDGSNDANAIAQLNGQVVPTQLTGAFLGIRLDDNGAVTINNVVEIEQPNIRAANGMVHIVNDVLLNRIIAAAVDNANLASAITPNPFTETETPTPEMTAEATPSTDTVAVGNIRIAHFVPDADELDVYINDTILESIAFGDVSRFVSLQPGNYNLAFAPVDTSIESAVVSPIRVTVADGEFTTIAAIGSVENDSVDVALLTEDYSELEDATSRLTAYNTLDSEEAIKLINDDTTLLENIAYGEAATLDIEVDTYRLAIALESDTDTPIIEPRRVRFRDGNYYFAAIIGTVDAPQLVITALSTNSIDTLRTGSDLITDEQSSSDNSETTDLNILDTLEERGEFTILLAALDAADDRVINRLGAVRQEPVTLLAPTDRAFENLLTTIGVSQEAFLRNTDIVTDILLYHMIEAEIFAADFRASAGTSVITMLSDNQAFFVTVTDNGTVLLNGFVPFEQVDIRTSNGIIHIIEDVLLPQSIANELGL